MALNQVDVQQENIKKPCYLILKDKDLPLEVEISVKNMDPKAPKQHSVAIPLNAYHSSIIYYISDKQKEKSSTEISKFLKFNLIAKTNYLNKTQQFLIDKQKPVEELLKYLPSFFYGSNTLKNFQSDFYFNQLMSTQPLESKTCQMKFKEMYNAAVLIYDGCSIEQLISNIKQFDDFKVLVFINGRRKFKQFISTIQNQQLKLQFLEKFNEFYKDYFTSSNHALFYDWKLENDFHLIIVPEKFDQHLMLKWIYQGLLKYIDPKFAFVASSNLKFNKGTCFGSLVQKLKSKSSKNQNLIGLQWQEEFEQQNKYTCFDFCVKPDLGMDYFLMDSNFKIKLFHNPMSCLYDWQKISIFIDDYLNEISHKIENSKIYRINEILPSLLYTKNKYELGYVSNVISTTTLKNQSEEESFQMNCLRTYDIQEQLYQGIQVSRLNITLFQSISLLLQNTLYKIFFFEQYFGLAICLFFSFQCPYQLISYILDASVGYTALAILIPAFNGLNILLILIISSLYSVQDKFQQKNQLKNVWFKINYAESSQTIIKLDLHNQYNTCEIIEKDGDKLKLLIKFDDVKEDKKEDLKEQQEYVKVPNFQKFKRIHKVFKFLLQNQTALDFTIVISVIGNIIISYGPQFLELDSIYKLLVIIFAIICLFFIAISKRLKIFASAFNLSFISFISYLYMLQQKRETSEQQIANKRNMAKLLILNCLVFYIFICIESYYQYSGYILLGILSSLSLIECLKSVLIFLGQCKNTLSNEQQNTLSNEQQNKLSNEQQQDPKNDEVKPYYLSLDSSNGIDCMTEFEENQNNILNQAVLQQTKKFEIKKNNPPQEQQNKNTELMNSNQLQQNQSTAQRTSSNQ